jgi:ABC-type bacteriocin/lantibiotic exporter with double-glycine peptidase domain
MMQTLGSGWDTILIGNIWNIGIWKNYFAKKAVASGKNQRRLILNIDIIATLTLMISAFPILIVLFMTFQNALGDMQLLAMLVATTPRQVTTIQYLSDAISLFVNLNDKVRRTKQLSAHLNFDKENVNKGQIKWGAIFISSKNYGATPVYSFDEIVTDTNDFKPGRYTITGSNGTGKTTLLADIKTKLRGNAYILPTHSKIIFLNDTELGEFSSGEKMAANLHEIADNVCTTEMSVILLDEWNANLDNENIKKLSKIIDDISINNCVIEVIHNYEKWSMDVVTH